MSVLDPVPMTDEDYANLPPLVKEGEDRDTVLNSIADKWANSFRDRDLSAFLMNGAFYLENVALVDATRPLLNGQPTEIDLGDLLRRVVDRYKANTNPEGPPGVFDPVPTILLIRCRVDSWWGQNTELPIDLCCINCKFERWCSPSRQQLYRVDFSHSRFASGTSFNNLKVIHEATFANCEFEDTAFFHEATFGMRTSFQGARMRWAEFGEATFGDDYGLDQSHINFREIVITGQANFRHTGFGAFADFHGAQFPNHTDFSEAVFGASAYFGNATFGNGAMFAKASFGVNAQFGNAQFGPFCNFGGTEFGPHGGLAQAQTRMPDAYIERVRKRWLHWNHVQVLGSMPVLNRVSYTALLVVPILAAVWAEIVGTIPDAKLAHTFPSTWTLAFFAALAVAVGGLCFQLRAPQLLKESTRKDHIERRHRDFKEASENNQDDLLQKAFEARSRLVALRPWDQHTNLVRRHGDVVWLPSTHDELRGIEEIEQDGSPIDRYPKFRIDQIPAIIIDEGAKAEYDAEAMDRRVSALVTAGAYFMAAWLIGWITIQQAGVVLSATMAWDGVWRIWIDRAFFWASVAGVAISAAFIGLNEIQRWRVRRKFTKPRPPAPV